MNLTDELSSESKDNATFNAAVESSTAPTPKTKQLPTRPGFQLVKVRMPDGTAKRVWRPIKNEANPTKKDASTVMKPKVESTLRKTYDKLATIHRRNGPSAYTVATPSNLTLVAPSLSAPNSAPDTIGHEGIMDEKSTILALPKPPEPPLKRKPVGSTASNVSSTTPKAAKQSFKRKPLGSAASNMSSVAASTSAINTPGGIARPQYAEEPTQADDAENTALIDHGPTQSQTATRRRFRTAVTRPAFGFLTRIGVTKAAETLTPGWDVGEVDEPQDGDEFFVDDGWSSDTTEVAEEGVNNPVGGINEEGVSSEDGMDGSTDNNEATGLTTGLVQENSYQGLSTSNKQVLHSLSTSTRSYQRAPAGAKKDSTNEKTKNTTPVLEKGGRAAKDNLMLKPPLKEAQPLHRSSTMTRMLVWSTMMGLPLLHILLGIGTITLRQTETWETRGLFTEQAIKLAITAWPIIFAAILAQSLKAFATYRVERGIRLMTLEQLISSHSFASAIKQPCLLRRFDLIAIALMCLWGLQPIASQGLQRMLYKVQQFCPPDNITITYMDLTASNPSYINGTHQQNERAIDTAFVAALMPKRKIAKPGVDLYNNPLIPVLHYTDAWNKSNKTSDGWYDALDTATKGYSASLYGVVSDNPIEYDNSGRNNESPQASFRMNTSYWRYICTAPVTRTWGEVNSMGLRLASSNTGTLFMELNPPEQFVDPNDSSKGIISVGTGNLTFISMTNINANINANSYGITAPVDDSTVAYATCRMNQTFVEAELNCATNNNCRVQRMRVINNPQSPGTEAIISFAKKFVDAASGSAEKGSATMVELYLSNSTALLNPPACLTNLTTLTQFEFEQKLGILLNTFWHLGFGAMYQVGYGVNDNYTARVTTTGTYVGAAHRIYKLNVPWLVTLFISSFTLLGAGIASAWWEHHTIGPDILGFASSLVRQSRYITGPKGSTAESGSARTNRMKDHEVMMQDVKPDAAIGKIALGTKLETSVSLKPNKLYR